MMTRTEPGAGARSGAAAAFEIPPAGDYQLVPDHCAITFTTRHLFGLGGVHGRFRLASGQIHVDGSLPASWVRLTVPARSFATGNAGRDSAAWSAWLLAADRYPAITFTSTGLDQAEGSWVLRGRLSAHGQDGPADARLRDSRWDGSLLRILATATVDRYAFGITGAKGLAGRRLDLRFDIAAVRQPAVSGSGPAQPEAKP
jgi:polyisoprenoid-binding protein YceI